MPFERIHKETMIASCSADGCSFDVNDDRGRPRPGHTGGSKPGVNETYTRRVPMRTRSRRGLRRLRWPRESPFSPASAPEGSKHEIQRQGNRAVTVTWTLDIKAGEAAEFTVAQNPTRGGRSR